MKSGTFVTGAIKGLEFFWDFETFKKVMSKTFIPNQGSIKGKGVSARNHFHSWQSRPIFSKDVSQEHLKIPHSDTAIVIQGPIISDWNFSIETVKLYSRYFPEATIIFSTWVDEDPHSINQLVDLGVNIVQSEKPELSGISNLNFQIVSSLAGVKLAKELGLSYTLKTRSDQRFYSPYLLSFLKTSLFEAKNHNSSELPLVVLEIDTFMFRLYGVSDFISFGETKKVFDYWDCPIDSRSANALSAEDFKPMINQSKALLPETYLAINYLKKRGHVPKWTFEDWCKIAVSEFVIVDEASLDFFWPKYSRNEKRWKKYQTSNDLAPFEAIFWKILKHNIGSIDFSNFERRLFELNE